MPLYFRRKLLRHSGCGLGSLAFAGMMAESGELQAINRDPSASPLSARQSHFPARAKRIIHLFMNGGPSQIDTFDPKPNLKSLNGQATAGFRKELAAADSEETRWQYLRVSVFFFTARSQRSGNQQPVP
ncbi:MAG: DUF1501 domain-containing protein [Fuerstiella sp.]|nr:DUF1501 domain-containing protein [Fuerstiella sp.]